MRLPIIQSLNAKWWQLNISRLNRCKYDTTGGPEAQGVPMYYIYTREIMVGYYCGLCPSVDLRKDYHDWRCQSIVPLGYTNP